MSYHVSSIALRQARTTRRNRNTVRHDSDKTKLGPVSNVMILALILALMGLLYLTQATKTNGYSYELNQLQQQQAQLTEEYEDLQVESARLQAIERIRTSNVAQDLTDPVIVEFAQ